MNFAILPFFFFVVVNADPSWDGLRVTWSPNPLNTWAFDGLARTTSDVGRGYTLRDDQCKISGAKFLGQRYWYKQDPALSILYDKNGIVAGIQTSISKQVFTPPSYVMNRNFVDDGDFWSLTAYFVDPRSICTTGRTKDILKKEGTGTGLWLQVGPDPVYDTVQIPMNEEEVKLTPWKFGHCFYTMGNHYWFNVTQDMNCDKFFPNCLLYNKGKLTAFCFSINANLPSERYEHPTAKDAKMFLDPVPDCFIGNPAFNPSSTIHVYMIDNARTGSFC